MKFPRYSLLSWKTAVFLFFLPVLVTGTAFLIANLEARTRYDDQYFTPEYLDRYQSPSALIDDLEVALQTGDRQLMAQLQGTKQAPALDPRPNMVFVTLLNRHSQYFNYLFNDRLTFHRYLAHIKMREGRHVVVPENLYYFFDSGRWTNVFGPPSIIWWAALVIVTTAVWIYRRLASIRKKMFG